MFFFCVNSNHITYVKTNEKTNKQNERNEEFNSLFPSVFPPPSTSSFFIRLEFLIRITFIITGTLLMRLKNDLTSFNVNVFNA